MFIKLKFRKKIQFIYLKISVVLNYIINFIIIAIVFYRNDVFLFFVCLSSPFGAVKDLHLDMHNIILILSMYILCTE